MGDLEFVKGKVKYTGTVIVIPKLLKRRNTLNKAKRHTKPRSYIHLSRFDWKIVMISFVGMQAKNNNIKIQKPLL